MIRRSVTTSLWNSRLRLVPRRRRNRRRHVPTLTILHIRVVQVATLEVPLIELRDLAEGLLVTT